MKSIIFYFLSLFCLLGSYSLAQNYPQQEVDLSTLADELFSTQDTDLNYEELYENMVQLLSNPINLNKTTPEELRFLNILSESQMQSFVKYKHENGPLISTYELQNINGFDLQTIYKLMPFVVVIDPASKLNASLVKRILLEDNNYVLTRYEQTLEAKKGDKSDAASSQKFKGSPGKMYFRLRNSRPGDFSVGFTTEKDAGEQMRWHPSKNYYGFDYLSYHVQIQNKGKLKNLILGDFQNQFAQGLMLGGSFGMGKGAETISSIRKSNIGLQPYTSANEASFLRGIASTYEVTKHLFLTGFFSNALRDAAVSLTQENETFASSFQTTGFHRNETELAGRKKITEKNYGAVINFRNNALDAGFMFNSIDFNVPVEKTPTPYNQFSFSGKQNQNLGAFINYSFHNVSFFSEACKSLNGGTGLVMGLLGSLTNNVDVSLLYRNYNKNFYSFYTNALSENTLPQNEIGLYWGLKYKLNKRISGSGYIDLFEFPWLRFRSYAPSNGYEWLGRITYQPSKQLLLYAQAREEKKLRNIANDGALFLTATGKKHNYWINCDYSISRKLKMRTRAQFSTYQFNKNSSSGMAVLQDVTVEVGKFDFTARYALFDTDDFDNRQYVYERDVWLAYSLPAYYGVGIRSFIVMEYKVSKKLSLWLRFARSEYTGDKEIGSGAEYIAGNTRNDVKFQLRLRL